ncbi:MAG: hypothetical protein WCA35_03990 [Kovacikia sp.]
MKLRQILLTGLAILVGITVAISSASPVFQSIFQPEHPFANLSTVQAQTPLPSSTPPSSTPPSTPPSTTPSATLPSPASPALTPAPVLAPPASTAPPLTLNGDYRDPSGRFKIGIVENFKVSPLAGSVLIEAADGSLAYSVVVQAQPPGIPIGLSAIDNGEGLAKVASSVFQRGESFQPGQPQLEAGGGVVINWTGTLTIGGNAQPMGGVILVRPSPKQILIVLIAATQSGAGQVPAAVAAIANSLQSL